MLQPTAVRRAFFCLWAWIAGQGLTQSDFAHAQTTAEPAASAPRTLEPVIVTAERRRVDLQQAPLAVTAITADTLDAANAFDLTGLNGRVPGLTITKSSGYERIVTIRGIGSETPENAYATQPGVSLHIDGVYIANTISIDQSLFDLDRIEVLRGPQGTLYGQSSTGGTINLITRQPTLGVFGGSGDVSLGNHALHRERAELNLPLGADWALRASVQEYGHHGYANAKAIDGGDYGLDDASDHGLKLAALWQPTPNLSATLTGQWYRANQHGAAQKNILDPDPDPRSLSQDYPARLALDADLHHLNIDWTLPWATLKSITAYQRLHHRQQEDDDRLTDAILRKADGSQPYTYNDVAAWTTRLENVTQEVDLASVPGGPVDWIVGAFAMRQRSNQFVIEFQGAERNPSLAIPADVETAPPANLQFGEDTTAHRTSYALFFQTTWHASDRLRLTAGGRTNHDRYTTVGGTFAGAPFNDGVNAKPLSASSRGASTHELTGKLAAEYDLTADSLVYASLTRGYKPGGLNVNRGAVVVPEQFAPETVVSYEVGSKNRLQGNTLRVNVAAFYYTYRDMQYLEVDPRPFFYGTNNVPHTDIWGAEVEASSLLLESRLRLDANLSLMNGRFTGGARTIDATIAGRVYAGNPACANGGQYFAPACWSAVVAAAQNLDGNRPAKLPRLQGSIDASYAQPLPGGTLTPRLEFVYRGDFNDRIFNDAALDRVPAYAVWNAHIAYQPVDGLWSVGLTGSNLFNRAGVNSRYTDPYGTNSTSQEFIAPRQIVATVGYAF